MRDVRNAQPSHPAVDWATFARSKGDATVHVTCPKCGVSRPETAKLVRYRISKGRFTGLCQRDAGIVRSELAARPEHPAVNWDALDTQRPGTRVLVTCPVCNERRWLEAKSVRHQISRGTFEGVCLADRFVARGPMESWPVAKGLDWNDSVMVTEADGRRRRMIRVRCPVCGKVRLSHASHLAESVRKGSFRSQCLRHRNDPTLSTRARKELLQLVRLVDATIDELNKLNTEILRGITSPVRASS